MAIVFLDTSALVRRYYPSEPGANRVRSLCAPSRGHSILLARLAAIEFAAALSRRVREGSLPVRERSRHWKAFQIHLRDQYRVMQATEEVFTATQRLVFAYPLRTLDALQLASALVAATRIRRGRVAFWTADEQQASAAGREGLAVELV
jgi:predicted nucleic acid-binding protein